MVKLMWQDVLVIFSVIGNVGARYLTLYVLTSLSKLTVAAGQLESNPIARLAQTNAFVQYGLAALSLTLILVAYWYVRRRALKDKSSTEKWRLVMTLLALFFFVALISDFLNDLVTALSIGL